jgi:hypothetical protein
VAADRAPIRVRLRWHRRTTQSPQVALPCLAIRNDALHLLVLRCNA